MGVLKVKHQRLALYTSKQKKPGLYRIRLNAPALEGGVEAPIRGKIELDCTKFLRCASREKNLGPDGIQRKGDEQVRRDDGLAKRHYVRVSDCPY